MLLKEAKQILKKNGYKLVNERLTTKTIYQDERNYEDAILLPIKTFEELKKLYKNNETIAAYNDDELIGEVYSFDWRDEDNSGGDYKDGIKDLFYEEFDEIKKMFSKEEEEGEDIDELALESDEFEKICDKAFKEHEAVMIQGDNYGDYGGERGIAVEYFENFKFFHVKYQ